MNKLTTVLLTGVALGALAGVPAIADGAQHFHLMALHAGRAVNKTKLHDQGRVNITSTFNIYTSVPASAFRKKVPLTNTFYHWNTISGCSNPPTKIKAPKKSLYAKVGTVIQTYSFGCSSGPTRFYGDTYKLMDQAGFGQTDTFVSTLKGWWKYGYKYKATLYLDVSVAIGNE